jgi:hypothetical protein
MIRHGLGGKVGKARGLLFAREFAVKESLAVFQGKFRSRGDFPEAGQLKAEEKEGEKRGLGHPTAALLPGRIDPAYFEVLRFDGPG